MSIEPTSVSNPVVRENENSTKRNVWSDPQGSATGSKDGQFSSFWDKALIGAQKLLGLESSSKRASSDSIESSEDEESEHRTKDRFETRRLGSLPGFGNSGFGRSPSSLRSNQLPPLPRSSESNRSPDPSTLTQVDREEQAHAKVARSEDRHEGARVSDLDEEEDSESQGPKTEKSAHEAKFPLGTNVNQLLNSNVVHSLVVDNQDNKISKNDSGINSAQQVGSMAQVPTVENTKPAAPTESGVLVS